MSNEWLETHRAVVHSWMCDHFGHMNVRFYAQLFDDAGFALWPMSGVSRAAFEAASVHTVVARTETNFRRELLPGRLILVRSRFVELGRKSVTYEQQLLDADSHDIHASQRAVEVFFDPGTRRAVPIPTEIRAILEHRRAELTSP